MSSNRSRTRLAVVQALYQYAQTGERGAIPDHEKIPNPDFFHDLLRLTLEHCEELDEKIADKILKRQYINNVPAVLQAILRAGAAEICYDLRVATAVLINEYVEITKNFFDQKEVSLVNGILDSIAKEVRVGQNAWAARIGPDETAQAGE